MSYLYYKGFSQINGPLVVLDHVKDVSYDEIAVIKLDDGSERSARVVEISGEKAV